jgi:hypothetical protein
MIVSLVAISVVSAILYRMGGCGPSDLIKEWGWIPGPIRNFPKKRDVGCSLLALAGASIVGITAPWWIWVISFGLTWGSLSTYWDGAFGYDNFYAHGGGVGLAVAPLMLFGEPLALGIRIGVLGLAMGIWSQVNGNATKEELGRGFVIPITLALCLVV